MSGHSKWHSIKHKKGALDAKRGKIFTMHAKLIAITARGGADPNLNAALRTAIDRAKADNVPNANIERAILKGSGQDKDANQYEEVTYEAFGPGGVVFMIDCVTDNKNRTHGSLRLLLEKQGGNLGSAGSVAWKFDKKAFLLVKPKGVSPEEAELMLIDCGAEELELNEEGSFELYSPADQLGSVKKAVEALGFEVEKDELIWKAKEEIPVTDEGAMEKVLKLMEKIEEDEDVNQVFCNMSF